MGNDCCVREDRTRADVVDLKQLYVQPTMKMPISKDSKIDINATFVIVSASYSILSPIVDLALRTVFANDLKWRSIPPVVVCASRSSPAGNLDWALANVSQFEFSTNFRLY